ncbi:MAG: NADH-flavin oxidoreductase, Old yellow enzyme family protein, partial [Parasporobacterium sp.]|nr:NADH-flavin oxidoreductase, Old yellow enzyme family protein [Parasporobacterium sp.]
ARTALLDEMDRLNIKQLMHHITKEILSDGVAVFTEDGEEKRIKVDSVIAAVGSTPDPDDMERLAEECTKYGVNYEIAGDCSRTGSVLHAVRDGYVSAMLIG